MSEREAFVTVMPSARWFGRSLKASHRTTDPQCAKHRRPRNWLARLRFDRNRGRACCRCAR